MMKSRHILLAHSALIALLLASCARVEPNFLINGRDTPTVDDPAIDSVEAVSVMVGQALSFTESSNPAGTVAEVLWDFDGDGNWDAGPTDAYDLTYTYDTPGLKHITMSVDGDLENTVTKRVLIKEEVIIPVAPDLNFLSPPSSYEETSSSSYSIIVQTTNIFSATELTLAVNNVPQMFEFNGMTGQLMAEVMLDKGENRVEVLAKIDGQEDEFSKLAYIVNGSDGEKPTNKRKKKKPKPDPKPDPNPEPTPGPVDPVVEDICEINYEIGAAAFPSRKAEADCAVAHGTEYTVAITPKQCVELSSIKLLTDLCGKAKIRISWSGGSEELSVGLTGGLSSCNIYDLGITLEKGVRYELSIVTSTGGSCAATEAPKLLDLSACDGKALSSKELDINFNGKQIIVDLEYFY